MRRASLIGLALILLLVVAYWGFGWGEWVARWATDGQRTFQSAMAQALRALKAGDPGAVGVLLGMCFAYGFFHAVGPGHGKILIGGYGVAHRVPLMPLAGLALVSSLAQAATAVLLVYGSIGLLGWGRSEMEGITDAVLTPLSYAAIAAIGCWLAARGIRRVAGLRHPHPELHACCGHRHGPSFDEVLDTRTWRDALILVGGIAVRPCTGALFLLLITWRMDVTWAGVAGAFAMGLGTASVTIATAVAAYAAREGMLLGLASRGAPRVMPVVEVVTGVVILLVSGNLLLQSLGRVL